jgi:hypothetical protein
MIGAAPSSLISDYDPFLIRTRRLNASNGFNPTVLTHHRHRATTIIIIIIIIDQ